MVRASARVGRWDLAAQAALAPGMPREALERTFLPMLEAMAAEAEAWAPLSEAAAVVLAGHEGPTEPGLAAISTCVWCAGAKRPAIRRRASGPRRRCSGRRCWRGLARPPVRAPGAGHVTADPRRPWRRPLLLAGLLPLLLALAFAAKVAIMLHADRDGRAALQSADYGAARS